MVGSDELPCHKNKTTVEKMTHQEYTLLHITEWMLLLDATCTMCQLIGMAPRPWPDEASAQVEEVQRD